MSPTRAADAIDCASPAGGRTCSSTASATVAATKTGHSQAPRWRHLARCNHALSIDERLMPILLPAMPVVDGVTADLRVRDGGWSKLAPPSENGLHRKIPGGSKTRRTETPRRPGRRELQA